VRACVCACVWASLLACVRVCCTIIELSYISKLDCDAMMLCNKTNSVWWFNQRPYTWFNLSTPSDLSSLVQKERNEESPLIQATWG